MTDSSYSCTPGIPRESGKPNSVQKVNSENLKIRAILSNALPLLHACCRFSAVKGTANRLLCRHDFRQDDALSERQQPGRSPRLSCYSSELPPNLPTGPQYSFRNNGPLADPVFAVRVGSEPGADAGSRRRPGHAC